MPCTFFLIGMTLTGLLLVGDPRVRLLHEDTARRRARWRRQVEGSTLLEATWTIIPLAIFLVTFVWGALLVFPYL